MHSTNATTEHADPTGQLTQTQNKKAGDEATVTAGEGVPRWSAYWTVTEHGHSSRVKAGENKGEFLQHDFVVRQYTPVGEYKGAQTLKLDTLAPDAAHPRQVNLVVFDPATGKPLSQPERVARMFEKMAMDHKKQADLRNELKAAKAAKSAEDRESTLAAKTKRKRDSSAAGARRSADAAASARPQAGGADRPDRPSARKHHKPKTKDAKDAAAAVSEKHLAQQDLLKRAEESLRTGQQKGAKFSTLKAHISASFHSFQLIFGRVIISPRVLVR